MALNALRTEMVTFTGTPGFEANGVTVGYRAEYTQRTGTEAKYNAIEGRTSDVASDANHKGQYYIQLGEQLYDGDLRLNNNDIDAFGRPARTWEYKGIEVGTYAKRELLRKEYTAEVTGKDLYDLLTKNTIDTYEFLISIDGETEENVLKSVANKLSDQYYFTQDNLLRTNTKAVGGTGNGVLTQVFVDPNEGANGKVYIAIINTYLAVAEADYNEKRDEADFTVWALTEYNNTGKLVKDKNDTKSLTVKGEDLDVKDVQDGDVVLVNVAEGEIKVISDPEVIDNTTIKVFKRGSWVNAEGTQYDYAHTAKYDDEVLDDYDDTNMKDTSYRIYLDQYGYLAGIEILEEPDQYVFLAGINGNNSNLSNETAKGRVIFLDGTSKVVDINMDKSADASEAKGTLKNKIDSVTNTWCKYSVDADGVYTLTEVADSKATFEHADGKTDKVGQSRNYDAAQAVAKKVDNRVNGLDLIHGTSGAYVYSGVNESLVTIDKKHVSLNGITNTSFQRVYGNDDTVYLTAETAVIQDNTGDKENAIIINGADARTVGVQNANLKAWNASAVIKNDNTYAARAVSTNSILGNKVSQGVYTLFKDNGYVLAAVVVGEDEGTTSQFAYITSGDVNEEAWGSSSDTRISGKGEYTWTRNVIINGEKTTLTEKNDTNPYLRQMNRGEWWEVRYNADGHVRKASRVDFAHTPGKFIDDIRLHMTSVETHDTVLMMHDLTDDVYGISAKGNTLQIDTRSGKVFGFAVKNDAPIILAQDSEIYRNGKPTGTFDLMDTIDDCGVGQNGLKKAVNALEANNAFSGYISAVFEGGVATSVVIWDRTHSKTEIGDGYHKEEGIVDVTYSGLTVTDIQWYNMNPAPTDEQLIEAIAADLEDQGYTVERIYDASGTVSFDVRKGNTVRTFTWTPSAKTKMIQISVNGSKVYIDATANTMAAVASAGNVKSADQGKWVKTVLNKVAGWTPVTPGTGLSLNEGDSFEFGYYKVTASTSAVSNSSAATNKGGDSTVSAPATADAVQYVKANAMNINFELTLTVATTGVVEVNTTHGTITDGATMPSGKSIGDKHNVTVALTADDVKAEPTVTLSLTDRTGKTVTVGGTSYDLEGTDTFAVLAQKVGVVIGQTGTYVKDVTDDDYQLYSGAANLIEDGHEYEFGYYKVTMPTTGVAVAGVTFTVTDSAAEKFVKKDGTFDLTITMSGTEDGTGNTKAEFTVANATMPNGTVTATSGTGGSAAVSGGNKLTVNATDSAENTSVFTVTVTVTGAGDVTFS